MSARRTLFDLKVALVGGRHYREFLTAARAAERSAPADLLDRQAQSAAELVAFARAHVPFYRDRLRELSGDFTDPGVFESIPILEKEDLRDNYEQLIAVDTRGRRTREARTGGSTGQPLRVLKDFSVRPAALTWRVMSWWGVDPSDNSASVERLPWHGLRHQLNELLWWPTRKLNVDAGAMGKDDLRRFTEAARRLKPRIIWGYAHSLHELALAIERGGWQAPKPIALSSTAAPLTAVQAADIERVFDAPVYETYRAAELSLIAAQCEHRHGMHVMADHKLLEVVDSDGHRVPNGQAGEIVVTDLMNRAQPLLRYRLGDTGIIDTKQCACGRPFPVLKSLLGRSNDVLRTPDGLVSIYSFASAFSRHPAIRQYQIHQMQDFSLVLKVVPSGADVTVADLRGALDDLAAEFHGSLPVSAELVSDIPHVRGKQKSVVSHIDQAQA